MADSETFERGGHPSIIQHFKIVHLYGYRTISLDSPYAATILIAQNGAGKTTLLNALDAFLRGQFLRLKNLQFSEIRCRLHGQSEDIVITYQDIQSLSEVASESELVTEAKQLQVEPEILINFLSNIFGIMKDDITLIRDDPVFEAAFRIYGYNQRVTLDYLEKLQSKFFSYNVNIANAISTIRISLKEYEILYLPTYRRIESPLVVAKGEDRIYSRKRPRFKIPLGNFSGGIQFGLSDISDRLSELNQEILFDSNRGYRKLSADIIKELLDGSFERADLDESILPTSEDLNLFFSRLKEGRRVGPFADVVVPDIDHLLMQNPQNEKNKFLLYFISKLKKVMQATKGIESQVENFINKCNKYLSNTDVGYGRPINLDEYRNDSKELRLKRADLSVYAISLPSMRQIDLDALSSGEKQMISLLAKLYLYPKQKIILIDEPELSLSIDWQRQILEDVINAPSCSQFVAITHSPFVFDNPLDPFARSLGVSIDPDRIPQLWDGDEHDGDSV